MSPGSAVAIWREHVEPVNAGKIGSPAVTTSPEGLKWIKAFLKECKGCRVDFVCLHYYGTSASDFKRLITKFHKAVKKPIWVTEWACQDYSGKNHQCSAEVTLKFLKETKQWMDKKSWIQRYAYYGAFESMNINPTNRLMTPNGEITHLGKFYLGQA